MIHDVIERFRHRFELWRREQREGSFWRPGFRSVDSGEPAVLENPKYEILWTEFTPSFIIREVSLYVGILLLFSTVGVLIDRFFPSARYAVRVVFLWLVGLWTFLSVRMAVDVAKKRKAFRARNTKSSNQSLEL